MTRVTHRQPQTDYDGMKNSLQQEWTFVQSITSVIGESFFLIEDYLHQSLLPDLLRGKKSKVPLWGVTYLPVNQAELAIPNPNMYALEKWVSSCVITGHLIAAIWVKKEFNTRYHTLILREGRGKTRC